MLDAMVGVFVMAAATSAMVLAVQLNEQAFSDAGRQSLSPAESELLKPLGFSESDIIRLEDELKTLPYSR